MTEHILQTLADVKASFKARKRNVWRKNADYWLHAELRHVTDVGDFLAARALERVAKSGVDLPVIIDMGCGSGWLARKILTADADVRYIGLDYQTDFIEYCESTFGRDVRCDFFKANFEKESCPEFQAKADLVVNYFNFFELAELGHAMSAARAWLKPGGSLAIMTIDKTFLLLAAAGNWPDLISLLREYNDTSGTKCFFQAIDLGDGLSDILVYPSVLYTFEDYFTAANKVGLKLTMYKELPFTDRPIPKIYEYMEFSLNE